MTNRGNGGIATLFVLENATSENSFLLFVAVLTLVPIARSNECSSLVGILMRYGMIQFLKGRDHYVIKNPMTVGPWDVQDAKVYNLSSMRISPDVKLSDFVKTESGITPCFRANFSVGFQEIVVAGKSRISFMGRLGKFDPVRFLILPFEVEVALRVCSPFELSRANLAIDLIPETANHTDPVKLAQLQIELEGFRFLQWTGVRVKGKGFFRRMVGVAVRLSVVNNAIKSRLEKRMHAYMLQKLASFTEKLYQRVERWVDRARKQYFSKLQA
ncbi:unnamed protein product [Dibothriocephalus latus]|uniref:Uncharacterized protein n=1 Tax=Dibothriocephalus latus TaxID=60516 RepID=A0A3P6UEZ8_DIBLA|nr:unnamed protein product [Dibothriocephalus latus]